MFRSTGIFSSIQQTGNCIYGEISSLFIVRLGKMQMLEKFKLGHCIDDMLLRFHKAEIPADHLKGISFLKPFQNNSLYQRIVITPDILNDNFRLSLLGNFRENLPKNAFRTVCNLIGATYDGLIFPGIVTLQNTMPPFLDFFSPGIFQNPI